MIIYMAGSGRCAEDIKSFEEIGVEYGVLLSFFDMPASRFLKLEARIKKKPYDNTKKIFRGIKK